MNRLLFAVVLAALPAFAGAQYKCKDERGKIQYLSLPRPGCTDMSGKPVDAPKAKAPAPEAKGKYALPASPAAPEKAKPAPPPPAPKQAPVVGALPSDAGQRKIDCRGYQQQLDSLNTPQGRKTPNHGARVAQVEQAMRGCK